MPIKKILSNNRVPIKIWTNDIEQSALEQLHNTAKLPFLFKHLAVMPDVHFGKGATIGSVIATKGAIIPSAVGVDIGCGMSAVKLPFSTENLGDLTKLRSNIERVIPVGYHQHKDMDNRRSISFKELGENSLNLNHGQSGFYKNTIEKSAHQLGTLGGGNHFIEICQDQQNMVWIILHSGSRNIGKVLAEKHIDKAKDIMKKYFIDLPDPDLAYFAQNTDEFKAYIKDLNWAQSYAKINREEMMLRTLNEVFIHAYGIDAKINSSLLFKIDCHHNYTQIENHFGHNVWITRKGAVSAKENEFGIIPGSMGTKSYIVKGKGNIDSFHSCSHGAGRKLSRTKAFEKFTIEDLAKQTNGIECKKDASILDEIPSAYKNIDKVMEDQSDLVDVYAILNQLICIKG